MNVKGTAQTEYASLSGKIHSLVIDKSLTISGACADAKATGDAIEKASESIEKEAENAAKVAVNAEVDKIVSSTIESMAVLTADEVRAICV
jgi:hypothetical protein